MNQSIPQVSIVIPVYNGERFIRATLDSVLKQTWQDLEIIVINDGSTDRSMEICRQFDDPRIVYVEKANGGLAAARNTGIEHARGNYLGFIDADDIWQPEKIAKHMEQFSLDPELGLSYSWSSLMDEAGKDLGILQKEGTDPTTFADCFIRNVIGNGSNAVLRWEVFSDPAIQCFDPDLRRAEDYELWSRIAALTSWKIACIPAVLVKYRINISGLSSNTVQQRHYHLLAMAKIAEYAPADAEQLRPSAVAHHYWHQARTHAHVKNSLPGLRAVRSALHYDWRSLNGNHCMIGIALAASLVLPGAVYFSLLGLAGRIWGCWQGLQARIMGIRPGRTTFDPMHVERSPESYIRTDAMPNLFFLCHKHRLMYLAISKNASTSLKRILYGEEFGQPTAEQTLDLHKFWGWTAQPGRAVERGDSAGTRAHQDYTKFVVYRDPVSRFISCYHSMVLYSDPEHPFYVANRLEGMGLDAFIEVAECILKIKNPLHIDEHLRPQTSYFVPEDVDYIVPIEKLSEFLHAKFGIKPEPSSNPTVLPRIEPTPAQIERIRKLYESDYAIEPNWPGETV